jgi:nicotinate dehydrogenase subunit A
VERFQLTVDSSVRSVECGPNTPLLYVLRNDLGIAAVRFGCGEGMCGACDVLVDGRAVHSCQTSVCAVTGKAVTTAAGLGCAGAPHPVQRAFIQEQATQCGYCVPGLLIPARTVSAVYSRPYLAHASLGPACGVALWSE